MGFLGGGGQSLSWKGVSVLVNVPVTYLLTNKQSCLCLKYLFCWLCPFEEELLIQGFWQKAACWSNQKVPFGYSTRGFPSKTPELASCRVSTKRRSQNATRNTKSKQNLNSSLRILNSVKQCSKIIGENNNLKVTQSQSTSPQDQGRHLVDR